MKNPLVVYFYFKIIGIYAFANAVGIAAGILIYEYIF